MVQWIRICPPMQGTQVQPWIQEDSTCQGATQVRTRTPEPTGRSCWRPDPRARAPQREATATRSPRAATGEQTPPATAEEKPGAAPKTPHSQSKYIRDMNHTVKKKTLSQTELLKFMLTKNYNLFYNRLGVSNFFRLEGQTANNLGFVPRCFRCNSSSAERKRPQTMCTQVGVAVFQKLLLTKTGGRLDLSHGPQFDNLRSRW